jgi:hypothetical protein
MLKFITLLICFTILFSCTKKEKLQGLSQRQKCIKFKTQHYHKEGKKWDELRKLYDQKCRQWKEYNEYY